MRKMLSQVLQGLERDDEDEPMDTVVRRFWSRTAPLSPNRSGEPARVFDLATARQLRAHDPSQGAARGEHPCAARRRPVPL
jgi:hypothetical protein